MYTRCNVVVVPLVRVAGERTTELSISSRAVKVAERDAPPYDAVMITPVEIVTTAGCIENVVYVAPAGTVTLAATGAVTGSDVDNVTRAPPEGAGPLRLTRFKADVVPPAMVAGESATEVVAIGVSVRMADLLTPAYVAVIVTGVDDETFVEAMLNIV